MCLFTTHVISTWSSDFFLNLNLFMLIVRLLIGQLVIVLLFWMKHIFTRARHCLVILFRTRPSDIFTLQLLVLIHLSSMLVFVYLWIFETKYRNKYNSGELEFNTSKAYMVSGHKIKLHSKWREKFLLWVRWLCLEAVECKFLLASLFVFSMSYSHRI